MLGYGTAPGRGAAAGSQPARESRPSGNFRHSEPDFCIVSQSSCCGRLQSCQQVRHLNPAPATDPQGTSSSPIFMIGDFDLIIFPVA